MKRQLRNDLLLLGGLLLLTAAVFLGIRLTARGGACAVVEVNGQAVMRLPLDVDAEVPLQTEGGYNLIRVEDGRVSVAEADCPDKLCVKQGEAHATNQRIVCLPHRLVVRVESAEDGPDAVAQ